MIELVGKGQGERGAARVDRVGGAPRARQGSQKEVELARAASRAIKKQLGEGDDDLAPLRAKPEEADLPRTRASTWSASSRLESMGANTPDAHITRKYLELIADLPWQKRADASDDLAKPSSACSRTITRARGAQAPDPRAHGVLS
ncbi:MAG: hypothetical protein M5U28_05505 [Sandaracinaceae bacterium]|nr:hypothetical protein [Sandaracinaceae bacterium]